MQPQAYEAKTNEGLTYHFDRSKGCYIGFSDDGILYAGLTEPDILDTYEADAHPAVQFPPVAYDRHWSDNPIYYAEEH